MFSHNIFVIFILSIFLFLKEAEEEWLPILTSGNIKAVNSFHKGLAQKFEIIFDTGHVCAGKPILPENQFSLAKYKKVNYKE